MAFGTRISTFFEGRWHDGNTPVMSSADHGLWLGTLVFDGARAFEGTVPDLDLHSQRIIRSAHAMGMEPGITAEEIEEISREGVARYPSDLPLYIRPMLWSTEGAPGMIAPDASSTRFSLCIEDLPFAPLDRFALGVSDLRRPRPDMAVTEAKAAALYAQNGRIMADARKRGFDNALSLDADGNVAETASSNVFLVRDGHVQTPKANGTFLAGITRLRCIELLAKDGVEVEETSLTLDDFEEADEIFLTANAQKITPVTRYKERDMGGGQFATRVRRLYWDYAHQNG